VDSDKFDMISREARGPLSAIIYLFYTEKTLDLIWAGMSELVFVFLKREGSVNWRYLGDTPEDGVLILAFLLEVYREALILCNGFDGLLAALVTDICLCSYLRFEILLFHIDSCVPEIFIIDWVLDGVKD
jgi:hypothetical protein